MRPGTMSISGAGDVPCVARRRRPQLTTLRVLESGLPVAATIRCVVDCQGRFSSLLGALDSLWGVRSGRSKPRECPPHHNLMRFARGLLVTATPLRAKCLLIERGVGGTRLDGNLGLIG